MVASKLTEPRCVPYSAWHFNGIVAHLLAMEEQRRIKIQLVRISNVEMSSCAVN